MNPGEFYAGCKQVKRGLCWAGFWIFLGLCADGALPSLLK